MGQLRGSSVLLAEAKSVITKSTGNKSTNSRRKVTPSLSLQEFIYRNEALRLYREVIRTCYRIPDQSLKKEMIDYAGGEFRMGKRDTELSVKQYNLSTGKSLFNRMKQQFGL